MKNLKGGEVSKLFIMQFWKISKSGSGCPFGSRYLSSTFRPHAQIARGKMVIIYILQGCNPFLPIWPSYSLTKLISATVHNFFNTCHPSIIRSAVDHCVAQILFLIWGYRWLLDILFQDDWGFSLLYFHEMLFKVKTPGTWKSSAYFSTVCLNGPLLFENACKVALFHLSHQYPKNVQLLPGTFIFGVTEGSGWGWFHAILHQCPTDCR